MGGGGGEGGKETYGVGVEVGVRFGSVRSQVAVRFVTGAGGSIRYSAKVLLKRLCLFQ